MTHNAGYNTLRVLSAFVEYNHEDHVEKLLQQGADVNEVDEFGQDMLQLAVSLGYHSMARLLLEYGAGIDKQSGRDGMTPLVIAIENDDINMVWLLIEAGADVNKKGKNWHTPLMKAAWEGHTEIARLLIDNGATVNADRGDGFTPLTLAVARERIDIVRLLVERGADMDASTRYGQNSQTALTMAQDRNYHGIVTYLKEVHAVRQSHIVAARNQEGKKFRASTVVVRQRPQP